MKDTLKIVLVIVGLIIIIVVIPILLIYKFDKESCYSKAENYNTSVNSYSFTQGYCFVTIKGKPVNIEGNYQDVNLD